jgi:hypothetical protein
VELRFFVVKRPTQTKNENKTRRFLEEIKKKLVTRSINNQTKE